MIMLINCMIKLALIDYSAKQMIQESLKHKHKHHHQQLQRGFKVHILLLRRICIIHHPPSSSKKSGPRESLFVSANTKAWARLPKDFSPSTLGGMSVNPKGPDFRSM